MSCSGWRPPAPSIRCSLSRAVAASPRSMASVSSQGGTEPASPSEGLDVGWRRAVVPAPKRRASASSTPGRRATSSASCSARKRRAAASRRSPLAPISASSQSWRARPLGARCVDRLAARCLQRVVERLGDAGRARAPDQHERRRLERVGEVGEQRRQAGSRRTDRRPGRRRRGGSPASAGSGRRRPQSQAHRRRRRGRPRSASGRRRRPPRRPGPARRRARARGHRP